MAAWIRAQHERIDLVGELARVVNTAPDAPAVAFRQGPWQKWALAHGLTAAHVEAMFKEYAYVSTEEKRACYDKYPPQTARGVSSVNRKNEQFSI